MCCQFNLYAVNKHKPDRRRLSLLLELLLHWEQMTQYITDSYARLFYVPQQNILFNIYTTNKLKLLMMITHSLYRFTESSLRDVVSSLRVKTAPPSAPDVIGFFSKLHEAQL